MHDEECWWESDEDKAHESVFRLVTTLEEDQRELHEKLLQYAWFYDTSRLMGVESVFSTHSTDAPITENVIESVIDTAKALIAKNRPKAAFMTDGADWSTQRKAKWLDRFIEAEFHRTEVYNKGVEVFRDACVWGTGALHIFAEGKKIQCERVMLDELRVDEEECRSAPPRQLHRVKFVDKHVLKARFPQHAAAIDLARSDESETYWSSYRKLKPSQIPVIESWHLPSGHGAKDGRWTICIRHATLQDKKYTKDYFPFVFYRWSKRLTGFYGRGLCEILKGIQLRINKHNRMISKAQDMIAVPRVLVKKGDANLAVKINNQVGQILPYSTDPPIFITPPAVSPEIYNDKQLLKQTAYQISGVSELSAQAKKPAGLDSGAALREFNDIETQRFSIQAQDYEHFFLEIARQYVKLAKELYSGTKYTNVWKTHNLVKRIPWDDVDLEEDMYCMSIEASSILARTPAGRLQGVIELAQSQLIDDKSRLLKLLGHPDLEREVDLETAAIDDIEAVVENLLDGKFETPEPFQNLSMGVVRVQAAYLNARRAGAPEDILEGFRQWMEQAKLMLDAAVPPPAPAPAMPAMPPEMGPLAGGAPMGAVTDAQSLQVGM